MNDNRPFAQLWPGNEVRGIAGENRPRCVCFSFELSFFFCFGMSFSDHWCVPGRSNRGRASPSLFSHSFPRSSELRKRWLLAIRQADWSNFRVPNNTVVLALSTSSLRKIFALMLVPKSLWTLPSPVLWNRKRQPTSRNQCSAISVFFRTHHDVSHGKGEYEARRRIDRKRDVCPRRGLWPMIRPITIGSWQKGRGRGWNPGEVCARRLFFFFFQVAPWLGRAPGGVHAVCMRGGEILGVQEAQLSWTAIDWVLFFFSSTLLDERCSNLSFENPNTNPKNRTVTEILEVPYAVCTVGGDDNMGTYHSRKSAFLPFSCGLYFF